MTPQEGHWGGFHRKSCRKVDPGPPERTGTLGPVGGWPGAHLRAMCRKKAWNKLPAPTQDGQPPPRWACWKLQPRGTVLGACGACGACGAAEGVSLSASITPPAP